MYRRSRACPPHCLLRPTPFFFLSPRIAHLTGLPPSLVQTRTRRTLLSPTIGFRFLIAAAAVPLAHLPLRQAHNLLAAGRYPEGGSHCGLVCNGRELLRARFVRQQRRVFAVGALNTNPLAAWGMLTRRGIAL